MKTIPLTQGKSALVDDADFDFLNQWKWCAHQPRPGSTFYAVRNRPRSLRKRGMIKMHKLLCPGIRVDHQDGDGLNNQRHNLRTAKNSQNLANRGKPKNNTSGYKGVDFIRRAGSWRARVRDLHLGLFDTAIAAARAYDKAAGKIFGEFARLNFPDGKSHSRKIASASS